MRSPTLQYFYLQKPLTLLLLIAVLSVLCWIGMGNFYTKGEPREASVAVSMIDDNNWVLPQVYADEVAYKPPLVHWMMAVFSLPNGHVTPFTARLPSAIAFILMVGVCFVFFGKRIKFQEAFLACLIMITSFELHRSAMTARVDMVLTALIVLGLINLFWWEDVKGLKHIPIATPLLLGGAALVKGPVGIVLPLLVFGIYLLLVKYDFWKIVYKLALIALLSLVLPAIWYYLAYRAGGQAFLDLVWAENFGRFLGSENLNIQYELGHEEPFWYNFLTLLTGFIPWTLLAFFSLFGLNYSFKLPRFKSLWNNILSLPKIKLFSLTAAVVIVLFYCIPSSKRSVYLMPAYPFIAVFLSQYVLYLTEYKKNVIRIFCMVIAVIGSILAVFCLLTIVTHLINPAQLASSFSGDAKVVSFFIDTWASFKYPRLLYVLLLLLLAITIYTSFYQLKRKINIKILYATAATYIAINMVADGTILPAYKDGVSIKPFAKEILNTYPEESKHIYVVNNLLEYSNMYGLNFYLHNNFYNFEKDNPQQGFLLIGENDFKKVQAKYPVYGFRLLKEVRNKCRDGEKLIQLYQFNKTGL